MTTAIEPIGGESALFASDPVRVLATARHVAESLGKVLAERKLVKHIGESDHVLIEGWTFLGSMVGVFASVEWSRPVADERGVYGWEARATARTVTGRVLSSAEAMTTRDERWWRNADDYALRSMAQTRAVSKALRLPLGFVVELAGYNATPAEEITVADDRIDHDRTPQPVQARRLTARELREQVEVERLARGIDDDELRAIAESHGVSGRASRAQLVAIHDEIVLREILADREDANDDLPDIPEVPTNDPNDVSGESDDAATDPPSEPA